MPPSSASNHTFHDAARDRDVPARIYDPVTAPKAVVVFSHGLGGTREGYRYLGDAWSAHGYRVVHVQHPGSDAGIFAGGGTPREKALRAIHNLEHSHNRPLDIRFVLDQLGVAGPVGVAGHSMGAHTALALLGLTIEGQSYRDPRIAAAMVMSAPRPAHPQELAGIHRPVLHITGTRDESPLYPGMAIDRTYCFHHIHAPDQWSVVIPEAHHFTFSDNPVWAGQRVVRDPAHQPHVAALGAHFFDAYLTGDAEARAWLAQHAEAK
jgi:predicted dienelactone hydrolase